MNTLSNTSSILPNITAIRIPTFATVLNLVCWLMTRDSAKFIATLGLIPDSLNMSSNMDPSSFATALGVDSTMMQDCILLSMPIPTPITTPVMVKTSVALPEPTTFVPNSTRSQPQPKEPTSEKFFWFSAVLQLFLAMQAIQSLYFAYKNRGQQRAKQEAERQMQQLDKRLEQLDEQLKQLDEGHKQLDEQFQSSRRDQTVHTATQEVQLNDLAAADQSLAQHLEEYATEMQRLKTEVATLRESVTAWSGFWW